MQLFNLRICHHYNLPYQYHSIIHAVILIVVLFTGSQELSLFVNLLSFQQFELWWDRQRNRFIYDVISSFSYPSTSPREQLWSAWPQGNCLQLSGSVDEDVEVVCPPVRLNCGHIRGIDIAANNIIVTLISPV